MLTEIEIDSVDIMRTISLLRTELNERIRHGDGEIEWIERVIDAFDEADRIVIR